MKIKLENGRVLNISPENSKMGKVYSFSVLPVYTCDINAPCKKECYAIRMENYRKNIKNTWMENTRAIQKTTADVIVEKLVAFIKLHNVKLFRWNVGGDFRLKGYFEITLAVAKQCPGTKFLAFTKCFEKAVYRRPKNYKLVLSVWHEFAPPAHCLDNVGFAYYDDGNPYFPIPKDAKTCPDGCDKCMKCFNIKNGGKVVFKKH